MLSKKEMEKKILGLKDIKEIMENVGINYYVGGNALLGIMRTGEIKNISSGIAVALKYEDYIFKLSILVRKLEAKGFSVRLNNNKTKLKEKIKATRNNFLYEIAPWYSSNGMRIRAKFNLPEAFFSTVNGKHFVSMHGENYQTFLTPTDYLVFRFGDNWKKNIDGSNRKKYENPRYWRKR